MIAANIKHSNNELRISTTSNIGLCSNNDTRSLSISNSNSNNTNITNKWGSNRWGSNMDITAGR